MKHLHAESTNHRRGKNQARGAIIKSVLSLILVLTVSTVLWAQGESPNSCSHAVSSKDLACSRGDCISPDSCTLKEFTAGCTATYNISARTVCSGGVSCANCQACVNVYDANDNFMANCHTTDCALGQCSHTCSGTDGVDLVHGQTYKLYVCLIPCVEHSCTDCASTTCRAEGCVYTDGTPCPAP